MNWKIPIGNKQHRRAGDRPPDRSSGRARSSYRAALCLLLALPVWADDLKSANELYDAGKFAEAAAAYQKIEPKTAHVYFNLGNAWFRQDKLGRAVLAYERARRLAPRDPDILANWRFAQQRSGVAEVNASPKPVGRFLENALASRTLDEWARYEWLSLWLTVAAVAGCVWLRRWRTGFAVVAGAGAVCLLVTGAALGYRVVTERTAPAAIVLAAKADARFAPLPDSTVHFQAEEGTRVVIREDRGPWLFVERADGQQGWVPADVVERVAIR